MQDYLKPWSKQAASQGRDRLPTLWSLTTEHPYKGTIVLLFECDYKAKASETLSLKASRINSSVTSSFELASQLLSFDKQSPVLTTQNVHAHHTLLCQY